MNDPIIAPDDITYQWLEDPQQIADLCQKWSQLGAIALDTEFVRTDTFYPKPGLLQLADGQDIYLIDPIPLADNPDLRDLLANEQVTKVLHSCTEDLEVLRASFGVLPSPVFDTQIAAAFCGFGFSVGYGNLVKAVVDVDLPKDATRSDWLARPLGNVQKRYAALDVAHLLIVYNRLLDQLHADNRLAWVEEDCRNQLLQTVDTSEINEDYYQKVRLAWKLGRASLAVLKGLCHWREQEARRCNVPRNRIIKDPVLMAVAQEKPPHLAKLSTVDGITGRFIGEYGTDVVTVIRDSLATPKESWPERLPKPLPQSMSDLNLLLKQRVACIAEDIGLPTEVLVRKSDLQALLRSVYEQNRPQLSERIRDTWRFDIIGQALLDEANAYCTSS